MLDGITRFFRVVFCSVGWVFGVIAVICALLYSQSCVYRFPRTVPFHGDRLFNPYASHADGWWKANFQMASRSWGGLTAGHDRPDSVMAEFRKYGYDVIAISDYQKINRFRRDQPDYVPTYEHGYNVWKRHQLGIGARRVNWYDLPFGQTTSDKQYVLNRLRPNVEFLALAHPIWMDAYTTEDMEQLTGYDALEVLNHYRNSSYLWDAALSSGHAVWGIGDDDSHNVYDHRETMRYWNMINASAPRHDLVLSSLKHGASYCVDGHEGVNENRLVRLDVDSLTMTVTLDTVAEEVVFIGQDGATRSRALGYQKVSYTFWPEDTYIRVEVVMPHSRLYLNPVFRWDGSHFPISSVQMDSTRTWMHRAPFLLMFVSVGFLGLRSLRRRPRPVLDSQWTKA
jgi:hypothetical protein